MTSASHRIILYISALFLESVYNIIWTFARVYSMVIRVTTHASQHPSGSIFETYGQLVSKLSFRVDHTAVIRKYDPDDFRRLLILYRDLSE
jgi:hypothetical protein